MTGGMKNLPTALIPKAAWLARSMEYVSLRCHPLKFAECVIPWGKSIVCEIEWLDVESCNCTHILTLANFAEEKTRDPFRTDDKSELNGEHL
jgi:hypothetical protein